MSIYERTIAKKRTLTCTDLYYKGRVLIQLRRWTKVESLFKKISQELEKSEFISVGYQVECKYWIAFALFSQNKLSEALELIEDATTQSAKRDPDLEVEGPFESFKEIKKKLGTLCEVIELQTLERNAPQEEVIVKQLK